MFSETSKCTSLINLSTTWSITDCLNPVNNYYTWLTEDPWSNFDAININIMCSMTQYQDDVPSIQQDWSHAAAANLIFRGDLLCWCILYMYCTFDRVEILLISWDIILQSVQKNSSTQPISIGNSMMWCLA